MSEELDIEAIEARCAAATPGPWLEKGDEFLHLVQYVVYGHGGTYPEALTHVCSTELGWRKDADAEFIAAARTDIPSLLLEVRRLRSLVSRGDGTEG